MSSEYEPKKIVPGSTNKNLYKVNFTVDLTKIGGDGGFPCPKCGTPISPDDETEDKYQIIETKVKGDDLAELVVRCKKCKKYIRLTGFLSSSEERENTIESETV
jgi:uncharacterized protein with PIN domain